MTHTTISVEGPRPYDVVVGVGSSDRVPEALPATAVRVLLVHSAPMAAEAARMATAIAATGREVIPAEVPDAEAGKTADVLAQCWATLGRADFTRSDVVVGLGGGAVTDLAGFIAATWLRGVSVVQVPTSLLAMVDAAVGGKTGINTPEGKNLVGAFHEPASVWCDPRYLLTLPRAELVAGLGEVVKAGFIKDLAILDIVESNMRALAADTTQSGSRLGDGLGGEPIEEGALPVIEELMSRAIRVKAEVVAVDLRESFLREILNYGHTLGHAIEHHEDYRWRHGAAISVGMVYAAELARLTGTLDDGGVKRHRDVLGGLGLPTTYPTTAWDSLVAVMRRDKKTRGAKLRFVVLDGIGNPIRLEGPEMRLLEAAYVAVGE